MGSLVPDLELDLKLFTKKTIGSFLKNDTNLKDFVCLLEEERRKIEAFKRELPLCMILVTDVINELKLEVEQCQNGDCVIEEFLPLKARSEEDKEELEEVKLEKNNKEKKDWMSSVQLWNGNCSDGSDKKKGDAMSLDPVISAPAAENRISESAASTSAGGAYLVLQAQRKARRCWSPELHRRFVMALQQLGGAQVATPKQIRELMMVDGLTNDEVKSHLQKYRLHTRRMPNCSASQVNRTVVMAGSLCSASQFGSPQGPLQLVCTAQALSTTGGDSCDDDGKSESYITK